MLILVADDEPMLCRIYQRLFRAEGHTVDIAFDGTMAIELAMQREYDAVIADVGMPGVNGIQVLAAIRATQPWIAALVMTGRATKDVPLFAPGGHTRVLSKPFHSADLLDALHSVVRASGPMRAHQRN